MRRTPLGIRYAERTDLQDGPALGQAMGEDIESLFNSAYVDLASIRAEADVVKDYHTFDGYAAWPRGPQIRGSTSGSSNLGSSGIAFVADRVRFLGTWVLADLIVSFAVSAGLSGNLELQLPYMAWSADGLVGSAVLVTNTGVTQAAACEQVSDTDYTRFTRIVDGEWVDTSEYWSTGAKMFVHLRYEAQEVLAGES